MFMQSYGDCSSTMSGWMFSSVLRLSSREEINVINDGDAKNVGTQI